MYKLTIGAAVARLSPNEPKTTPDDRKELAKAVYYDAATASFKPTAVAVGLGRCSAGDITLYSGCSFDEANWAIVVGLWENQTLCTVVGVDGVSKSNCRIRVTGYSDNKLFPNVKTADIEVWRV